MTSIASLTIALAGMTYMSNQADAVQKPAITVWVSSAYQPPERCPGAQRAIGFYRRAYTASRNAMSLTGAVPRVWYGCPTARRRAVEWRDRAWQAKKAYADWHEYHYDWQKWLPWNWQGVARCETHFNWEHNNSRFVSAFGISWREYNADAAYMGAPPWHIRHTPRDQYLAALGHYKRFGDGWTCPGP